MYIKRYIFLFLAFACCIGCSNAQSSTTGDRILIVYLSRTNNTKIVAEIIQRNIGGKIVSLELKTPYPADYRKTVEQVVQENETGYLPPLKTVIDSFQNYNIVFIGFPTWGMKLPPPIKSFLKQYSFAGKKVVPFNTNDGYGIGSSFDTLKELCVDCKILEGFSIKGGRDAGGAANLDKDANLKDAQIKVKEWLQRIKQIR